MKIDKIEQIKTVLLCKLSKIPIGDLPVSCVTSIEKTIDDVPKLTLKIKKYYASQDSKKKTLNPLYDEVRVKRYIFLNDEDYYLIEEVSENKLSNVKEVTAYKGEQRLSKYPIEIEDIGIELLTDDPENDVYSLNDLLSEVGWKLGSVDESVAYDNIENKISKMRWQTSINTNWLEFISKDIAEQFDCLPLFDTINKTIDLVDINTLGEEIKLVLSKDNYLKSKQRTIGSNDLITLLKLKGSDDLDLTLYIPTGYDFITDFSYFIELGEMSNELANALNKYDEMVAIRKTQWEELVNEKISKQTELDTTRTQWQISISTIDRYKKEIDKYALNEDEVNENLTIVKLAEESDNELLLRHKIDNLLDEIYLLEDSIFNLNILCKYPTATDENGNLIFNSDLLDELQEFIFVDEYQDDSFIDGNALLEKGKSVLAEKSRPTISISIDSINFLNRIIDNGFRLKWNGELSFGDIVILIDDESGKEEFFYFIGYSLNYESNTLELNISNKKTNRESTKTINEYLKEVRKMNTLLVSNRYLFNDVKNNRLNIDKDDIK